jgi:hypothetical protein
LTTLQASPKALSNEEATQKLMRKRLEASEAAKAKVRQVNSRYAAELDKFAREEKERQKRVKDRERPTPERLKRGDLVQRPLHGPDGFVVSHNYVSNFDVQKLSNSWPPSVAGAYALFVRDACKLGITRVSMNYERIGGPVSNGTFGIAIETDEDYQATADRHDFIMRKLHTFDATGDMSVAEVLNFVLCHVESVRLGTDRVKSWADVGRLFEPGYKDEATSKAHARSAFNVLGRFMAGCYLEFFAIYGGEMRKARVRTREVNP